MRFLILFFLIFLPILLEACDEENPFSKLNPIVTLFCPHPPCHFFNTPVDENIRKATVRVIGAGTCSGLVIRLKRGEKKCKDPLLLTAGHCVAPEKDFKLIRIINYKGTFRIPRKKISSLQEKCLKPHNCLVSPDYVLEDEFHHSGVDQALIPMPIRYRKKGNIPVFEIDIDKVANKEDLDSCFKDPYLQARITSVLTKPHLKKMKKNEPKTRKDYIQSHTCHNLSWMKIRRNEGVIKRRLGHRCPTLDDISGSFINLKCHNKKALFVHEGQRVVGTSNEVEDRAEAGEIIYSSEYERRESFKNIATHIEPELLEFYFHNYCDSNIAYKVDKNFRTLTLNKIIF